MKRVAHYRDRYNAEVLTLPWVALRRAGFYRDLRRYILSMALPRYFEWEVEVLRQEMHKRWLRRAYCFPYLNTIVDLCPEIPFGETEGKELRLMSLEVRINKFQPALHLVWRWVHPYATDI